MTKKLFLRPHDRSLEAFKEMINNVAVHLGITDDVKPSEQEWVKAWKSFWGESATTEVNNTEPEVLQVAAKVCKS